MGGGELGLKLGDLLLQGLNLVLQLDDALDSLEAKALGGEARDLAQQLDVAQRVAAPAATGAAGLRCRAGRTSATSADAARTARPRR